ncbi:MAG: hypothetical protein RSE54_10650 [Ruthenibacterium sp.]
MQFYLFFACAWNYMTGRVCGVRPLKDYKLWLRFTASEVKLFDCTPLMEKSACTALADEDIV